MRGVITIEAALLFPIIIYMITAMVVMGMMLHDTTYSQGQVYSMADKAAKSILNDYNVSNGKIDYAKQAKSQMLNQLFDAISGGYDLEMKKVSKELKNNLKESLLVYTVEEVNAKVDMGQIKIQVVLSNKFSEFPFIKEFNKKINIEKSVIILDECEIVRITDVIFN